MTLTALYCLATLSAAVRPPAAHAQELVDLGSRLELFVDDHLIDRLTGDTELQLHKPEPKEVVLVTDKPWEGNTCAYYTVFQDGDVYRMYYRGSHYDTEAKRAAHPEFACYAESKDGLHWTKPELGLFELNGSKANSIIWAGAGTHDFTPFRDANPDCRPDAKYKALGRTKGGLLAFKSADAIHWSLMSDKPVITKGAFDSQNLAFWDSHAKVYREFHRTFAEGVRHIQTATSKDFLKWPDPTFLDFGDAPKQHLYTNAILPYERAPHLLLGFPTRFLPATQQVEPTFMTSRDGLHFRRWLEALIPVSAPKDRDGNRSNYMTWGMLRLPGNEREYSMYATEAYYTGPDSRVRRFTYRVDGFVSVSSEGLGELLTKPLTFAGKELVINFAAAAEGSLRVELQDDAGKPLPGFTLGDCLGVRGDEIEQVVRWKKGADVSRLVGRPVRIRFLVRNADLYSIRFR